MTKRKLPRHRRAALSVLLALAVTAQSRTAATDSVYLADGNGQPLPKSVTLTAPTGLIYVQVIRVDSAGNTLGRISCTWTTTGTLHAPAPGPNSGQYYTTTSVVTDEYGCIIATAADGSSFRDSICVSISAPPAWVTTAFTRDTSGNGLLDRIEVHFNKMVWIPDTLSTSGIVVTNYGRTDSYHLPVCKVAARDGTATDSVFYVNLTESHPGLPQTAWLPTIQLPGVPGVTSGATTCTDGAGPVIWSVAKYVSSPRDHTKDAVTVTFSEDLERVPGATDMPGVVFQVWTRSGADYAPADSMLAGIDYFLVSADDNSARFQMLNGEDLTDQYYFSIRMTSATTPPVVDNSTEDNPPNQNNQKVQVQITSGVRHDHADGITDPTPAVCVTANRKSAAFIVNHPSYRVVLQVHDPRGCMVFSAQGHGQVEWPLPPPGRYVCRGSVLDGSGRPALTVMRSLCIAQ